MSEIDRDEKQKPIRSLIIVSTRLKIFGYILAIFAAMSIIGIIYYSLLHHWELALMGVIVATISLICSINIFTRSELNKDFITFGSMSAVLLLLIFGMSSYDYVSSVKDLNRYNELISTLKRGNYKIKADIVKRLGNILQVGRDYPPSIIDILIECLVDSDPTVRREAVQALHASSSRPVIAALVSSLEDADESVRREAVRSLGRIKAIEAKKQLNSIGRMDPSPKVRSSAAWALWRIGDIGITTWILCDFGGRQLPDVKIEKDSFGSKETYYEIDYAKTGSFVGSIVGLVIGSIVLWKKYGLFWAVITLLGGITIIIREFNG